jgi:hypothetical protein
MKLRNGENQWNGFREWWTETAAHDWVVGGCDERSVAAVVGRENEKGYGKGDGMNVLEGVNLVPHLLL